MRMEASTKQCDVCKNDVDPNHLLMFGEDSVCTDCKETYVQCLKEGLEPTFDRGVWRHRRYVYCETNADLTAKCICCSQKAVTSKSLGFTHTESFRLELQSTEHGNIDVGFCRRCRKKLDHYAILSTMYTLAFAVSFLGPMILGWVNSSALNYIFIICLGLAAIGWVVRLCLMSEPGAVCHRKTKLIRISGTERVFREALPEIPPSRLNETRD